jgi:hypothetical protein
MLARCTDTAYVNAVANHPSVRPYIGAPDMGQLDFTDAVADDNNLFLMGAHGGFSLIWSAPMVREVHVCVLPEGRGQWAARARQFTSDYAANMGVRILWARIARAARSVVIFARQGGMQPTGETLYTLGAAYDVYAMELPKCRKP